MLNVSEFIVNTLGSGAVDLVLDVTVAVDSVDVVEQAYYYQLLILK